MAKVGIYSGSFDPVHNGHLSFAKQAIKQKGLDKVFFLVEPRPRRKQGVKAHDHRVNMLKLALSDDPKLGHIVLGHARFTVEHTLPILQQRFKNQELVMMMGDDFFTHFSAWPHVKDLIKDMSFLVGIRKGSEAYTSSQVEDIKKSKSINMNYDIVVSDYPKLSSSLIRRQLKNRQKNIEIPKEVFDYIGVNKLYASNEGS